MVFGAMIIGAGAGIMAMIIAVLTGSTLLSAFLLYCLTGCVVTLGICAAKVIFCPGRLLQSASSGETAQI